ncbi:Ferric uptake regulation protein [Hyphomicrobiales bacterium]|nr:Ferric uptake regulation protein [Hyphomicrobiales bacterium]CAH1676415.1 Ferric uptake regulation protein [Hyphomicrobiales bacterium]
MIRAAFQVAGKTATAGGAAASEVRLPAVTISKNSGPQTMSSSRTGLRPDDAGHHRHVHGDGDAHAHSHEDDCDHAQERAAQAPQALAAAEALCERLGVRLTPIRREVLETLLATHRPMGAYDLVEDLARRHERRMAPITVYRALDFLLEHGLIHKLATQNAFVACPHQHAADELVIFLICESCGGVDEIFSSELSAAMQGIRRKARFTPRAEVIEITGLCGHCGAMA